MHQNKKIGLVMLLAVASLVFFAGCADYSARVSNAATTYTPYDTHSIFLEKAEETWLADPYEVAHTYDDMCWQPMLHFDAHYFQLRENIIREQGLVFNQAYHFRMDDGRYALVTGWHNLIDPDQLTQYYWFLEGLPREAGGFHLAGVYVNDRLQDSILICHQPISFDAFGIFDFFNQYVDFFSENPLVDRIGDRPYPIWEPELNPIPLNQVFTRNMQIIHSFKAIYMNNDTGQIVTFGAFPHIFDNQWRWYMDAGLSADLVEMGAAYGAVMFVGEGDEFYIALLESTDPWLTVVIGIQEWPVLPDRFWWGFSPNEENDHLVRVARSELEELIRIFNPLALVGEYRWPLLSFQ